MCVCWGSVVLVGDACCFTSLFTSLVVGCLLGVSVFLVRVFERMGETRFVLLQDVCFVVVGRSSPFLD